MHNHPLVYPHSIQQALDGFCLEQTIDGRIGDQILRYVRGDDIRYVKISRQPETMTALAREHQMLQWLAHHDLHVPHVLAYHASSNVSCLVMDAVAGCSAHLMGDRLDPAQIVTLCGQALQAVHRLPVETLPDPFRDTLTDELQHLQMMWDQDRVDDDVFQRKHDRSAADVLAELWDTRTMFVNDTFTHGDYCLPNVLLDAQGHYGFVDWAQGGMGDPYRDIGPFVKSIRRNVGAEYIPAFYQAYGLERSDVREDKIAYYDWMDEVVYCVE